MIVQETYLTNCVINERVHAEIKTDTTRIISIDGALFFDIETTGLSRTNDSLTIIGMLRRDYGQTKLTQIFLESPAEEPKAIRIFLSIAADSRSLIHYNGDSFDIPFIAEKCRKYGLSDTFTQMQSYDIYRLLAPFKKLLGLKSLRQKDAERLVGYPRTDQLSGSDVVTLYFHYLKRRDREKRELLLLHNRDDVIGMTAILPLLNLRQYLDLPDPSGLSAALWSPAGGTDTRGCIALAGAGSPEAVQPSEANAHPTGPALVMKRCAGPYRYPAMTATHQTDLYGFRLTPDSLTLTVPAVHTTLKLFYPGYRDYYYLPEEDMAIHKSVGACVDRAHRRQATASTCYRKITGLFLPVPRGFSDCMLFSETCRAKQQYCLTEDLLRDRDAAARYFQKAVRLAVH